MLGVPPKKKPASSSSQLSEGSEGAAVAPPSAGAAPRGAVGVGAARNAAEFVEAIGWCEASLGALYDAGMLRRGDEMARLEAHRYTPPV